MTNEVFVTCGQELEPLLLEELQGLGFEKLRTGFRGIYIEEASLTDVYRLNYCSRLASRVLWPLKHFRCYNAKTLYKDMMTIDWLAYIPKGKTFAIDANVTHSQLRNSLFAAQVVKDAICDQFREKTGSRPNVETQNPDVQLNLFIREPLAILSFDTSGSPLNKRGYRLEAVEAPMQETLAAALLKIAKYEEHEILCDPCCGSGTLLIEAALMATNTPPGYLRQTWGFMRLPEFSQQAWLKVKAEADKLRKPIVPGRIFGCDINKNAVRICKTNLRAAGFHSAVEVVQSDFREYTPEPPPTLICTNPPHGKRLDDVESLKPLYRALGDFLKRKSAKPSRGFIFTSSMDLSKEVGLAPSRRYVVFNSGIESRFLQFDLY